MVKHAERAQQASCVLRVGLRRVQRRQSRAAPAAARKPTGSQPLRRSLELGLGEQHVPLHPGVVPAARGA